MPRKRKGRLEPIKQYPDKGVTRLLKREEKPSKQKGVEIRGKDRG